MIEEAVRSGSLLFVIPSAYFGGISFKRGYFDQIKREWQYKIEDLKVIYKGFLNSCIVSYASEASSSNNYVENRIRKFQLVHKLQQCFSSHYLFPARITSLEKSMI